MATCKKCQQTPTVYGLFTENQTLDLDIEFAVGVVAGGFAASKVDGLMDKVEFLAENNAVKQTAKIGVGVLLTQFGIPFMDGAGYGMIAVAATDLVNDVLGGGENGGDGSTSRMGAVFTQGSQGGSPAQVYGQPFTGMNRQTGAMERVSGQPFTGMNTETGAMERVGAVILPNEQGSSPAQVYGVPAGAHKTYMGEASKKLKINVFS